MTLGYYEDNRSDGNYEAAVNSFCFRVEKQILIQGLFDGDATDRLRELTVKFETLEWIGDEKNRLDKRMKVAAEIKNYCATYLTLPSECVSLSPAGLRRYSSSS
jgi:hypothetical protein